MELFKKILMHVVTVLLNSEPEDTTKIILICSIIKKYIIKVA